MTLPVPLKKRWWLWLWGVCVRTDSCETDWSSFVTCEIGKHEIFIYLS